MVGEVIAIWIIFILVNVTILALGETDGGNERCQKRKNSH